MSAPSVLNVHTPSSSFAIVHSFTQESLVALYDKLSRKGHTDYAGQRVGPGWLKYEYNENIWNLDDESDYTIFVWRQQQGPSPLLGPSEPSTSTSSTPTATAGSVTTTPTLHLHNPSQPLPTPPAYLNPAYYAFRRPISAQSPSPTPSSARSRAKSKKSIKNKHHEQGHTGGSAPVLAHKKQFDKFHSENGVRTVMGSIGPVENVRMLLKSGYRHVYISRKFAQKHGFIPADAAPGLYGYGGLVNIGTWPITLTSSSSFNALNYNEGGRAVQPPKPTPTKIAVYLSEEPHFDVVLGRSFFEKRSIRTNALDLTDVVCLDTGEKVECEVVILKDGRGEIVTVT